jgi:hypothetical protein
MIEKREVALAKLNPAPHQPVRFEHEYDSDNANDAMLLLGICEFGEAPHGGGPATRPFRLQTWATQAAISRPGRRRFTDKDIDDIKRVTLNPDRLKWSRRRRV